VPERARRIAGSGLDVVAQLLGLVEVLELFERLVFDLADPLGVTLNAPNLVGVDRAQQSLEPLRDARACRQSGLPPPARPSGGGAQRRGLGACGSGEVVVELLGTLALWMVSHALPHS
jgi:hypothetical protein